MRETQNIWLWPQVLLILLKKKRKNERSYALVLYDKKTSWYTKVQTLIISSNSMLCDFSPEPFQMSFDMKKF